MRSILCIAVPLVLALAACQPAPTPKTDSAAAKTQAPAIPDIAAISKDSPMTVDGLAALLSAHAPEKVAEALAKASLPDGSTQLELVFSRIGEGGDAWLRLAPVLKPALDAGNATIFKIMVGQAISDNPSGVLKVLGGPMPVAEFCRINLIEPTPVALTAYRDATIKALNTVTDPALIGKRDECLAAVKA